MSFNDLISLCKRRGFIFQSSEIYGGINGFWDFGPLGVELRNNVKKAWWSDMVTCHNEFNVEEAPSNFQMTGLETSIITHPQVWKVSGHYDLFHDMMVDCRETKLRYRYDHIRGRWVEKGGEKIFVALIADAETENEIAQNRALKYFKLRNSYADQLKWLSDFINLSEVEDKSKILAPDASSLDTLTEPKEFNLMFKTYAGAIASDDNSVFLRPETAQGIFINFKNVIDSSRFKLPLGIAQIGKSFRNEITPRHFIFRSREFEQMEIEFFCHPSESKKWYNYWKERRFNWLISLGLKREKIQMREHDADELSHYSSGTADIEYNYPFLNEGEYGELEGIAHRGDFDLRSHMEGKLDPNTNPLEVEKDDNGKARWKGSGKNLKYRDDITGETYTPHVIEPSIGVDRVLLAFLADAYTVDKVPDENGELQERTLLKLHPRLAPVKAAIFPLTKKENMPEIAKDLYGKLKTKLNVTYDEKDAIGRRYRRADEIGVPICITIDGQTLIDNTVTFRHRDSLKQWRVKIEDCLNSLEKAFEEFNK
ncbi:MAG: glycine--tRNA ligase [Alphaproteobacteria bacterium]